jgi:hypothetical protein
MVGALRVLRCAAGPGVLHAAAGAQGPGAGRVGRMLPGGGLRKQHHGCDLPAAGAPAQGCRGMRCWVMPKPAHHPVSCGRSVLSCSWACSRTGHAFTLSALLDAAHMRGTWPRLWVRPSRVAATAGPPCPARAPGPGPPRTGRSLRSVAVADVGGAPMLVATTHLESPCPPRGFFSKERVAQMRTSLALLADRGVRNVLFAGAPRGSSAGKGGDALRACRHTSRVSRISLVLPGPQSCTAARRGHSGLPRPAAVSFRSRVMAGMQSQFHVPLARSCESESRAWHAAQVT